MYCERKSSFRAAKMGILRATMTLTVIAGFALSLGCRMCASPHDYSGPVVSGGGQCDCYRSQRAGSAFAGVVEESQEVLASAQDNPSASQNKTHHSVARSLSPATEYDSTKLGRPLTRADIDPFVRLGIPPENILSVTDRPIEEDLPKQDQLTPQSPTSDAEKQPKLLSSLEKEESPTSTGWVRLGNRTSAVTR